VAERELTGAGRVFFWGFRALWTSLVIAVPTLGVWVGSSIAAYLNGPVWLVCLSGVLLFPGLPLLWDWVARRKVKVKRWHKQHLTIWDRLVLRTLAINFVFLTGLLVSTPHTGFSALSTRGDWVLDGVDHPVADDVRAVLFKVADGLEWIYEAANENEYEEMLEGDGDEEPDPKPRTDDYGGWDDVWNREGPDEPDTQPDTDPDTHPDETPDDTPVDPSAWPQPAELHPLIADLPDSAMQSPEAMGEYIRANESDPYLRVKAIHDFVANHVAYDGPAYRDGRYPPQDADTVFRTGLAVCAGYANLIVEIGNAADTEIVRVVGDARSQGGEVVGESHAWNAAYIEDQWYLMDATWDSGHLNGREFVRSYSTGYLFPPPQVMGITHFPENESWQLRKTPLSRGEFGRQPMMRPRFFSQGFSLESPRRSQVTVDREFEMRLGNPKKLHVLASYTTDGGSERTRCRVDEGQKLEIACDFPAAGTYHVMLFSSKKEFGSFDFLGEIEVNASG
jgi:hypothetical protein